MSDETTISDDRYLSCRRFIFREGRTGEGEADVVSADMCKTPVGIISSLDCPVWLGRHCRFFEEREGDAEPLIDAEIEELRGKLRKDYLRWRYRLRTQDLRSEPVDAEDVEEEDISDGTEIPARPEALPDPGARQPRFPGDAPSGPPPKPVEEVDLDKLPEIRPADIEDEEL